MSVNVDFHQLITNLRVSINNYKNAFDANKPGNELYQLLLKVNHDLKQYSTQLFMYMRTIANTETVNEFENLCKVMILLEKRRYGKDWDPKKSQFFIEYNYAKGFTTNNYKKYWSRIGKM